VLNSPRFQDLAPRQVWAQLLDEGQYRCSWRTMYRVLAVEHQVRERRHPLRHPAYTKPGLVATAPNQLWSWDITTLRGPTVGSYFYLYVILDVFSRYVVGWMVAQHQSAELAMLLIATACQRQGFLPAQLTVHADRGAPMITKSVEQLLDDLGVTMTHSRPHVSPLCQISCRLGLDRWRRRDGVLVDDIAVTLGTRRVLRDEVFSWFESRSGAQVGAAGWTECDPAIGGDGDRPIDPVAVVAPSGYFRGTSSIPP